MYRRLGAALALLVLLLVLMPSAALAHPQIVRTEPERDATLVSSPPRVLVVFNEEVEAAASSLTLLDVQGRAVDRGGGGRAANDPTALELPLPPLPPGTYTAFWHTVGSDGHAVRGSFSFAVLGGVTPTSGALVVPTPGGATPTVGALAVAPAAPPPSSEGVEDAGPPTWLAALLRGLMLIGALGAAGGWIFAAAIPLTPAALPAWRRGGIVCGLVLCAAAAAMLWLYGASVAAGGTGLWAALTGTRYGQALLTRLLLGFALVGLVRATTRSSWPWIVVAAVVSAGLLLTFALSGHAAAGAQPLLPIVADWLHLVAGAAWLGGLLHLVLALPHTLAVPLQRRSTAVAALLARFSPLALLSVAALGITGTYAALRHVSSLALLNSSYGQALLAKLSLFAILLLFGARHLLLGRRGPGLGEAGTAGVRRSLWGEVALALPLLLTTGLLTALAPPVVPTPPVLAVIKPATATRTVPPTLAPSRTPTATSTAVATPQPFVQTQIVSGVQVTLEISVPRTRDNTFLVTVRDASGRPIAPQLVRLRFGMLEMDMGDDQADAVVVSPGQYRATGWLAMVGTWRIKVSVRRLDAEDVEAVFDVPVRQ